MQGCFGIAGEIKILAFGLVVPHRDSGWKEVGRASLRP
jgi:hypothetical protein